MDCRAQTDSGSNRDDRQLKHRARSRLSSWTSAARDRAPSRVVGLDEFFDQRLVLGPAPAQPPCDAYDSHAPSAGRPERQCRAVREVFPDSREQRCWFHVQANVLNALPKPAQPGARAALAEIYGAEDREHALAAVNTFAADYGA